MTEVDDVLDAAQPAKSPFRSGVGVAGHIEDVRRLVKGFEEKIVRRFNEAKVVSILHTTYLQAIYQAIAALDIVLKYEDARGPRLAVAEPQIPLHEALGLPHEGDDEEDNEDVEVRKKEGASVLRAEEQGTTRRRAPQYILDLLFCSQYKEPEDDRFLTSLELKAVLADPHLIKVTVEAVERLVVLQLADLGAAEQQSLLKKVGYFLQFTLSYRIDLLSQQAAVSARLLGHNLFFFCDGISYFLGANVSDDDILDIYDTLISPVYLVAASDMLLKPSLSTLIASTYYAFYDPRPVLRRCRLAALVPKTAPAAVGQCCDLSVAVLVRNRLGENEAERTANRSSRIRASGVRAEGEAEPLVLIFPDGCTTPVKPIIAHSSPSSSFSIVSEISSSALNSAPAPSFIHLHSLLNVSESAQTWSGSWANRRVVVKSARRGQNRSIRQEGELLLQAPLAGAATDAVPALILCKGGGKMFLVLEWGGKKVAGHDWLGLPLDMRIRLFVSLLRLHALYQIRHNDAYPRNTVATKDGTIRWIDWGLAEQDHKCAGVGKCSELVEVWGKMGLEGEEEAVRTRAVEEDLEW
ncbi:hypothetical protein JCM11251_003055 [Rhodosporidiobolus azoricus]